jgi:hypothetical protein
MAFNERMDMDSKAVQHSEATNDTDLAFAIGTIPVFSMPS